MLIIATRRTRRAGLTFRTFFRLGAVVLGRLRPDVDMRATLRCLRGFAMLSIKKTRLLTTVVRHSLIKSTLNPL